jgi:hypothetical protein
MTFKEEDWIIDRQEEQKQGAHKNLLTLANKGK